MTNVNDDTLYVLKNNHGQFFKKWDDRYKDGVRVVIVSWHDDIDYANRQLIHSDEHEDRDGIPGSFRYIAELCRIIKRDEYLVEFPEDMIVRHFCNGTKQDGPTELSICPTELKVLKATVKLKA